MRVTSLLLWFALLTLPGPAWAGADTSPEALVAGLGVALLFGLAGFLIGQALDARRRAVVHEELVSVSARSGGPSWPAGLPPVVGRQVWRLSHGEERSRFAVDCALRLGAMGPVLLLPDPGHRATALEAVRGTPGVRWLTGERPAAEEVLGGLKTLGRQGPAVVVVDGVAALSKETVLEGFLEDMAVPALVLLAKDTPAPTGWDVQSVDPEAHGLSTG